MKTVPVEAGLLLAGILFVLGLISVLIRRNIIFMLISVEIMLNAAGLAFIVAGSKWAQPDGQIMFIFILTMAAAEVSVGLALILQIYHQLKTLDGDAAKADFPLSNKPDFLPGSPVEISAGYKGQNQLIFKGMVIKHSIKLKENKSTFLLVDCRHGAVKATKTRKNKIR